MKKSILVICFFVSVIISIYIAFTLYPSVHPLGALKLDYNKSEAQEKADSIISKLNLSTENKTEQVSLQANSKLTHKLYKEHSFSETNKLLRSKIPGYYWEVEWGGKETGIVVTSDSKEIKSPGKIVIDLDTRGNLVKFQKEIADSLKLPAITPDEAKALAYKFITEFSPVNVNDSTNTLNKFDVKGPFKEQEVQKIVRQGRTDYKFRWKGKSADINKNILIDVTVSGDAVSEFDFSFDIPGEVVTDTGSTFSLSTVIPFYLIVIILIFNNRIQKNTGL